MSDTAVTASRNTAFARRSSALLLLVVVVLPSLFSAVVSLWFGHPPPLVNLDLLVCYVLIVVFARRRSALGVPVGVVLVALICAVPILRSVGWVYIADPAQVAGYLAFIQYWPWAAFAKVFGAALLVIGAFAWLLRRTPRASARLAPAVALLLLVQAADAISGASRFSSGYFSLNVNISTSSAYQLFAMAWQWSQTPAFRLVESLPVSMAAQLSTAEVLPPRIASISVESWGIFRNPAWNDLVLRQLRSRVALRYSIEFSSRPFMGGTLSGELRELCGAATRGVPSVEELSGSVGGRCAPAQLVSKGYATWAGHANFGEFYHRVHLYPEMGFQKSMFKNDFGPLAKTTCPGGVFAGPCDSLVLRTAADFLASRPAAFVHVMTLDTHFPLRARTMADHTCPPDEAMDDADLCLYVHRFADALDEIASVLASAIGGADLLYLYGDHAPPYAGGALRAAFDPNRIPVLVLRRRDSGSD